MPQPRSRRCLSSHPAVASTFISPCRSGARYTAEMRSVADQSSAVEEKTVQVCDRNFHILRSAKGAYVLHPGSCRTLSVCKPVGRRMHPATGLFDDSHLQRTHLVTVDKPSDPDNYALTPQRLPDARGLRFKAKAVVRHFQDYCRVRLRAPVNVTIPSRDR